MTAARVIVADPAWKFGDSLPGPWRGAQKHYHTMSPVEILTYLPDLERSGELVVAPDAVLFLWRVASQVHLAYHVLDAWGFQEKSEIVWRKLSRSGLTTGKLHFGMGRSVRAAHESCVVAHRGRPQRLSASVRSVFDAPIGRHSEKPDEFYQLAEALYPGPYVELFARRRRPGWVGFGDECPAEGAAEAGWKGRPYRDGTLLAGTGP